MGRASRTAEIDWGSEGSAEDALASLSESCSKDADRLDEVAMISPPLNSEALDERERRSEAGGKGDLASPRESAPRTVGDLRNPIVGAKQKKWHFVAACLPGKLARRELSRATVGVEAHQPEHPNGQSFGDC